MSPQEALSFLDLSEADASRETISRSYRRLAMEAHQTMAVASAGERLRVLAEARTVADAWVVGAPCPVCDGAGQVRRTWGWAGIDVACLLCDGTGRRR